MNYLINALLAAALFVGFQIAQADVQINEDGTCHVPQDQNNGGVEIKTFCEKSIISIHTNGKASGYGRIDEMELPRHLLNEKPSDEDSYTKIEYTGDGGVPCNMNTENGTTYTTLDWKANISIRRSVEYRYRTAISLHCYNAEAQ